MVKCSFTGKEIPKGKGIMYVKRNGQVLFFINSKAKKNYFMGRSNKKLKWITKKEKKKKS
ncbi:MAG: 50S ribosomal protein L24e [Candidatus Micrarchaeota archaeon]|nr:50S ribosomal protein L24e [Candidatus Micrarchaeota archaeon]